MEVCKNCGRNIFYPETICRNCNTDSATGVTTSPTPVRKKRIYAMLEIASAVFLGVCCLGAFCCFILATRGFVLENTTFLLEWALTAVLVLVSGFLLRGFVKLLVDVADDICYMADKASGQIELLERLAQQKDGPENGK